MKVKTVDGNEACANSAYIFTELAGIYPITPASPMAEHIDEWSNEGRKNIFDDTVKVVEMQSEAGAIGMVHGALQSGILTSTFTASQGLLLMIPNMYKIAGQMFPAVLHVAARSIATHALSIMGDHQDIYAARATGFALLASSSVQDAAFLSAVAHLSTIDGSIPFLHFFDGFRTSHELQKIRLLENDDVKDFINYHKIDEFRARALQPNKNITRGTNQNDDVYFQNTEARNQYYEVLPVIVEKYMSKINRITGMDYQPFNYYGSPNAKYVIVAMGSVSETIKEYIRYMEDEEIGFIEVHLYRPFSIPYLLKVLPSSVEKVAVLDRTKEAGSAGEPLFLDVVDALKNTNIKVIGGRYGLSSKDTNPICIKAIYDNLKSMSSKEKFTVGIIDDVSNLSLSLDDTFTLTNHNTELLLYGYGSDGMVSAGKSMIKVIGDNTRAFVQGYFQYDSKKSGGVTRSHLRISKELIQSTYYVSRPHFVACSKESYLYRYNMLAGIKENGIFLLNTDMNEEEVKKKLPDIYKSIIATRNIRFYIVDAYGIAREVGLDRKISMIMESAIFKVLDIIDYDGAKKLIKELIEKEFSLKGEDIVTSNHLGVDKVEGAIHEVTIDSSWKDIVLTEKEENMLEKVHSLKGDTLPVSAFDITGTIDGDNTKYEKRRISEGVPKWIPENCIQCNQCSLVCPHAVIRPFLVNEDKLNEMPEDVRNTFVSAIGKDMDHHKFAISISVENCTGCGLCVKTCPGRKQEKALVMSNIHEEEHQVPISDYLFSNVENEPRIPINTVKGSQFQKPRFVFNGACAGCGETPYIKLATQLFGSEMIIANATGCSSIYGASYPSMPYSVPWANSLFEDNAEFGFGMKFSGELLRNRIQKIMERDIDQVNSKNKELFQLWIEHKDDYEITKKVYDELDYSELKEINSLKEYLIKRSVWIIGGDGWAYDIGYGGLDHVLASGEDVNILVLDTEVYSNTGGQSSKSTRTGAVASFANSGKKTNKKDLARIAMSYPNVYVAQVSMGANYEKTVKAFCEAACHKGPSLILAYAPCISHGIKGGLQNTMEEEKLATESGYYPIFRYHPVEEQLIFDMKEPNFDLLHDFLMHESRYKNLYQLNKEHAEELLQENKKEAMKRYQYYRSLTKQNSTETQKA